MQIISHVSEAYSNGTLAIILAALLAISEALALIPGVKANSIFQAIYNGGKSVLGKLPKAEKKPE